MLTVLTFLPVIGALGMLIFMRGRPSAYKTTALVTSIVTLGVAIYAAAGFDAGSGEFAASNIRSLVESVRSMSIRLDSIRQVWEEHSHLIDHLEGREKAAAVRLIKQHVSQTAEQVLAFLRSTSSEKAAEDTETSPDSRRQARGRAK